MDVKHLLGAAGLSLGLIAAANAQPAGTRQAVAPTAAMASMDTDRDGTLSLDEVSKAAEANFAALDTDRDGTLDARELAGLGRGNAVARADQDKDGTLDKAEYLSIVEERFKRADADHDGTLDAKELRGRSGQAMLKAAQPSAG